MSWQSPEAALKAITAANEESDIRLAMRICDEALSEFPQSAELWSVQAHHFTWKNRRSEAASVIIKAQALKKDCALMWAVKAELAGFEARFDDAMEAAERALQLDDTDLWVLGLSSGAYIASGESEKSLKLVIRLRELFPDSVQIQSQLIDTLKSCGRMEEAEASRLEMEQRFPDSAYAMRQKARKLMLAQQLNQAIEILRLSVKKTEGSALNWAELASALSFAALDDEAEIAAKRALEISGCALVAMQAMERICRRRSQIEEAVAWRQKSIDAIPALGVHAAVRGVNDALRNAEWQKALDLLEPLLTTKLYIRRVVLGCQIRALLGLNRAEEAKSVLADLNEVGPFDSPDKHMFEGRIELALGNISAAEQAFRAGITKYPTSGELRSALLNVLSEQAKSTEADGLVQNICSILPETPWGFSELVLALQKTGYKEESVELRRKGLELFPNSQILIMLDAADKLLMGDTSEARRMTAAFKGEFEKVASKMDEVAEKKEKLARFLSLMKKKQPPTSN